MRAILADGVFRTDLFYRAVLLNVVYMMFGLAIFLAVFRIARKRGLLLQVGE